MIKLRLAPQRYSSDPNCDGKDQACDRDLLLPHLCLLVILVYVTQPSVSIEVSHQTVILYSRDNKLSRCLSGWTRDLNLGVLPLAFF